jgi:hypothetical protein
MLSWRHYSQLNSKGGNFVVFILWLINKSRARYNALPKQNLALKKHLSESQMIKEVAGCT